MSDFKKIILIDFDGVIHRYDKGWDDGKLGEPMPGAFEFLKTLCDCETLKVMIYSSRSCAPHLRREMIEWFRSRYPFTAQDGTLPFEFPKEKPPAFLTIDDRAMQFKGEFPSVDDVLNFAPYRWQDHDN